MRSRAVASMVVLALGVSACSRDDASTSTSSTSSTSTSSSTSVPATTTSSATTTTTTTSLAAATTTSSAATTTTSLAATTTTTTLPPGACGALGVLAPGIIESAAQLIDVDADGFADTVRSYTVSASPVAGDWHLRVELAAGGGVDLALPFDPAPAGVTVLGGSYIGSNVDPGPTGARPAIFVTVGAGASASAVALYRLVGCALLPVTGGEFVVGGGVMHTEHLRCEGVAGTSLLVYVTTQYDDVAALHEIIQTAYTRSDNTLTAFGVPAIATSPTLPVNDLIDNCGVDSP